MRAKAVAAKYGRSIDVKVTSARKWMTSPTSAPMSTFAVTAPSTTLHSDGCLAAHAFRMSKPKKHAAMSSHSMVGEAQKLMKAAGA